VPPALLTAAFFVVTTPAPLRGVYTVSEERGTWQPIELGDMARVIEQTALEVLSRDGLFALERLEPSAPVPASAEVIVRIRGRAVEEAETHSVHLSFEPLSRQDLPALHSAETVSIGKLPRATMVERLQVSARKAAMALIDGVRAALAPVSTAAPEEARLPWTWAEVRVPLVKGGDPQALYGKDTARRQAVLRSLTSGALVDASPRNALERCARDHPEPEMRLSCLRGLRPLSRRLAPTQRVIVEVFRRDTSGEVRAEASAQMEYFAGVSRAEAVLAWLERAALGDVVGPLKQLGDLPSLDQIIAKCLVAAGKRPKYQRGKSACLELLGPLTVERRWALLAKPLRELDPDSPYYLEGAGEREGSTGTDWQRAVEAVLDGARRFPPEFEEILWRRYERTLSSSSLDVLADYAPPSEKLANRLLEVVQTAGDRSALRGLVRLAHADGSLRPLLRERLAELSATGNYPKTIAPRDLDNAVRDLK
jgi:hypothetical protein